MVTAACVVTRPPSRGATSSQVRKHPGRRTGCSRAGAPGRRRRQGCRWLARRGGRQAAPPPASPGDLGEPATVNGAAASTPARTGPGSQGNAAQSGSSDPAVATASPGASGCVARTAHRHHHGGGQLDERQPGRRRALADQLRVVPGQHQGGRDHGHHGDRGRGERPGRLLPASAPPALEWRPRPRSRLACCAVPLDVCLCSVIHMAALGSTVGRGPCRS